MMIVIALLANMMSAGYGTYDAIGAVCLPF